MLRTLTLLIVGLLACGTALAEEAPEDAAPSPEQAPAAEDPEDEIDALIAELQVFEPQRRIDAIQALAERGDSSAVPALTNVLRTDPSPQVRGWTVRALHQLDTPEARTAIARARSDADERVSALATRIAGPIPAPAFSTGRPSRDASAPAVDPSEVRRAPVAEADQDGQRQRISLRERVEERRSRRRDPRTRMIAAGWATFGATYGISLVFGAIFMAADPEIGGSAIVPLVGTAVTAQNVWYNCGESPDCTVLGMMSWLNSMFQITSFIIAIFGHRYRRNQRARRLASRRNRGITVAAIPGETPGLALSGWF